MAMNHGAKLLCLGVLAVLKSGGVASFATFTDTSAH